MHDFSDDPTFRDAPVAYGVIGSAGALVAANERLLAMFGLRSAGSVSMLDIVDPRHRDTAAAQFAAWIDGRDAETKLEAKFVRGADERFWARLTARVTELGGETRLLAVFEDIDAERRLRMLESNAAGERTAMVTRASHELRNPLNVIAGLAELLAQGELPEASRQQAAAIQREAAGLIRVVNDLFEIGRAGAGSLRLHSEDFAVRPLVSRLSRVHGATAASKGIALSFEIDDAVPMLVHGDADRLLQVISNVVGNAVKFTDDGSVVVRLDAPESGHLRFVVVDSGPGVPDRFLRAIFEPFVQAEHDRPGAGLGLSIAASFVELMGGRITVENTGTGARFTIVVPFPEVEVESVPAGPVPQGSARRAVGRVLVVEDSQENQLLMTGQLAAHEVEHVVVDDGHAALHALEHEDFSLVLMDWHLPDISGLETIRRWRFREVELRRERIPIVAITARAMASDARTCLDAGADDYLRKPASLHDIGRVLQTWLPTHPERRARDGVLNRSAIDAMLDDVGDPALVAALLQTYLRELPQRIARIVEPPQAGVDVADVESAAHVLKSTSTMVGGASLAALAARIESGSRDGVLPSTAECEELSALATETEAGIRSIVDRLQEVS